MSAAEKLTLRDEAFGLIEEEAQSWEAFKGRVPKQFFDKQPGGENAKKLLTAEEAAAYLGGRFTEGAIRMKTHRREIPFYKIGADTYYTAESLEIWKALHFIAPKFAR